MGVTSADLCQIVQPIPTDIDTNIWLYAENDKIKGRVSYSKSITYDRMIYVINHAWENGIPMIIFDGCENCRYTDAILKVLNGGSFISWMRGLSKRFVFISFLQGSKSNSVYGFLYNGLYRNPAVFNYTFPDYRQSSRCGKINVLWKQNGDMKKFSLLLHSTGKNVQSAKIHDKPWVSY